MWQMFCPGLMLALVPQLAPGRVREALVRPQPRRAVWWLPVSLSLTGGAVLAATAPLRFGIDIYQLLVDAARPLFAVGYGLIVAAAIAGRPWRRRSVVGLGTASYGIYLLHPLIATALVRLGIVPFARATGRAPAPGRSAPPARRRGRARAAGPAPPGLARHAGESGRPASHRGGLRPVA